MNCTKCNNSLPDGQLFCPVCGEENVLMPDIDILEDDFLRHTLKQEDDSDEVSLDIDSVFGDDTDADVIEDDSPSEEEIAAEKARKAEKEKAARLKAKKAKEKRIKRLITVVLIIIFAAVVVTLLIFTNYRKSKSPEFLTSKAEEMMGQKDYDKALEYANKLYELDTTDENVVVYIGDIYRKMKDVENAKTEYFKAIKMNPNCGEAYKNLLEIFASENDYDAILSLRETATDTMLELFEGYLIKVPVITPDEGLYDTFPTIEMKADAGLEIVYTADGTDPTAQSQKYSEPITLEEQGTFTFKAAAINANGDLSDIVTSTFEVKLKAPDKPAVSPDGGRFPIGGVITVSVPEGITVYYTWEDAAPTTSDQKYTGPITIPEGNNVLSLIAVDQYGMQSEVLRCNYIYYAN